MADAVAGGWLVDIGVNLDEDGIREFLPYRKSWAPMHSLIRVRTPFTFIGRGSIGTYQVLVRSKINKHYTYERNNNS